MECVSATKDSPILAECARAAQQEPPSRGRPASASAELTKIGLTVRVSAIQALQTLVESASPAQLELHSRVLAVSQSVEPTRFGRMVPVHVILAS